MPSSLEGYESYLRRAYVGRLAELKVLADNLAAAIEKSEVTITSLGHAGAQGSGSITAPNADKLRIVEALIREMDPTAPADRPNYGLARV